MDAERGVAGSFTRADAQQAEIRELTGGDKVFCVDLKVT
jgi:hypothetical protein